MSGSIETDWPGLQRMAKEFIDLAASANDEELENGFKCFGLAFLNCEFNDDLAGRAARDAGAPALWRIMSNEYWKHKQKFLGLSSYATTIEMEQPARCQLAS